MNACAKLCVSVALDNGQGREAYCASDTSSDDPPRAATGLVCKNLIYPYRGHSRAGCDTDRCLKGKGRGEGKAKRKGLIMNA